MDLLRLATLPAQLSGVPRGEYGKLDPALTTPAQFPMLACVGQRDAERMSVDAERMSVRVVRALRVVRAVLAGALALNLASPARTASGQVFTDLVAGTGSGRGLCSLGTLRTSTDKYEEVPATALAECERTFGDASATAIATTDFAPAIADAVALTERVEFDVPLQVNARAELLFRAVAVPNDPEMDPPPFIPLTARVGYTMASLPIGMVTGGCHAVLVLSQTLATAGTNFDLEERYSSRFDGLREEGTLEVELNADPSRLFDVEAWINCGATASLGDGPVSFEAQGRVGAVEFEEGIPLEPIPPIIFDQETLDEELGEESFDLEEAYSLFFVDAPEPGADAAGYAALLALAGRRRAAARRRRC